MNNRPTLYHLLNGQQTSVIPRLFDIQRHHMVVRSYITVHESKSKPPITTTTTTTTTLSPSNPRFSHLPASASPNNLNQSTHHTPTSHPPARDTSHGVRRYTAFPRLALPCLTYAAQHIPSHPIPRVPRHPGCPVPIPSRRLAAHDTALLRAPRAAGPASPDPGGIDDGWPAVRTAD
jgi:hypothetical protein